MYVPRVIENDPDDDHVIACAVAAKADIIVSGDKHLHSIRIVQTSSSFEFHQNRLIAITHLPLFHAQILTLEQDALISNSPPVRAIC
jgi:predicted nucleic acid-binding protein